MPYDTPCSPLLEPDVRISRTQSGALLKTLASGFHRVLPCLASWHSLALCEEDLSSVVELAFKRFSSHFV